MSSQVPQVSVLIPCRNEAKHIEDCLANIYGFAPPPGGFEVIVIDGMSNDGTRDILCQLQKRYPGLIVLDNLRRTVPHGMNIGIERARGEYIVRADVRCVHPSNYLVDLVELSQKTRADNVGGVLVPVPGETYVQKSIAWAYKSRVAMGGALRDRGDFVGETDTVYGGCFKKSRLIEIGMYDEGMVRNQDDELSFRLRKKGGKIVQYGKIKVQYFPRNRYSQLFKQFMQYGYWKVAVIEKHAKQASFRHLLPALFVTGLLVLGVLAPFHGYALTGLVMYLVSYLAAVGVEVFQLLRKENLRLWPGVVAAIALIHVSFGIGFLISLVTKMLHRNLKYFESLSR
ncbi:MAG TPA: glycosyltransferase family 2 protein [Thermodesulfobacteriota bacterium]|nr:glycosyltransferase family 2 protein [Thermodesulfobacteriota bacterium]